MVWGESPEIAGVAYEHPMFLDEIFLQRNGVNMFDFTKHEVGLRWVKTDAGNFAQFMIQSLCLLQIGFADKFVVLE